jgi:molecular chaperone GrpE
LGLVITQKTPILRLAPIEVTRNAEKEAPMTKPQTHTDETAPESEILDASPDIAETDVAATRIAELEKQLAEMKDRALREMADAENTRRRAQKEREDTSKYAVSSFAKEMLGVADNFSRALEASPQDVSDPAVKNLITGIEATQRQLQAVFDRAGIKRIEPIGEMFDPNFHQVMVEIDAPGKPAGMVVQVLQAGYVIHDRLLREALVAVAKGSLGAQHIDTSA